MCDRERRTLARTPQPAVDARARHFASHGKPSSAIPIHPSLQKRHFSNSPLSKAQTEPHPTMSVTRTPRPAPSIDTRPRTTIDAANQSPALSAPSFRHATSRSQNHNSPYWTGSTPPVAPATPPPHPPRPNSPPFPPP